MYRKIFISFLLLAFINLITGCYSFDSVTVHEYEQIEGRSRPNEIYVVTRDSQEYHFSDSNCYIDNDTLHGKASFRGELSFEGAFTFSEIESIHFEDFRSKDASFNSIYYYQWIEANSGKPDEIYLTKFDSTRYHFMKDDYYINNDTLYGKEKLIFDGKLLPRNISLSDIETINYEYEDGLKSIGLVLGIIAILVIIGAIAASNMTFPGIELEL